MSALLDADGVTGAAGTPTFPSALVRAAFDGPPPSTVALAVTDGFGTEATVTATAEAEDPL